MYNIENLYINIKSNNLLYIEGKRLSLIEQVRNAMTIGGYKLSNFIPRIITILEKLKFTEELEWLGNEYNGYYEISYDKFPNYRFIRLSIVNKKGKKKKIKNKSALGLYYGEIGQELLNNYCKVYFEDSLIRIEDMIKNNDSKTISIRDYFDLNKLKHYNFVEWNSLAGIHLEYFNDFFLVEISD